MTLTGCTGSWDRRGYSYNREAAKKVNFTSADPRPFVLTPAKFTESSSALTALAATAANVIASERYHIDYQDVEVNTDLATLFLGSILLPMIGGKSFMQHEQLGKELAAMDIHDSSTQIHRYATNVYKTKDARWYHLHGSMNAKPAMAMLGIEESDVTADEAFMIYSEKVAQWDSQEIERVANDQYRQAGVVCLTPEEFHASEQGRAMAEKPLWSVTPVPAPRKTWPRPEGDKDLKPPAGIKVLDLSRVIAAPAVSKILAVLGAEVLRVSCDALPEYAATMVDLQTGKRDTNLNLKTDDGRTKLRELVKDADLLVNGFRPTALAKLGFSTEVLRALNPSLIYMRENCYGFDGPLAGRSGWQQISDCLVGLAHMQGKFLGLGEPVVPLLPNSDYQTGLVGAVAAMQALHARTTEDKTFNIDISLTQYNIWLTRLGFYSAQQQQELRAGDPSFGPRHFDDMAVLVQKSFGSFKKVRPDLFTRPDFFWPMSGAEYGLKEDIHVLAPAFNFSSSKLEWSTPSGRRGRSAPHWLDHESVSRL
ncbi:hypothetical protein VD0001_g9899 [Verticillium dahliae]|nr:hypothetical protein VD0001_g9899 [Verticillium dahliae]